MQISVCLRIPDQVDIRVLDVLGRAARSDFQVHGIDRAAVDQMMAVAAISRKRCAVARARRRHLGAGRAAFRVAEGG